MQYFNACTKIVTDDTNLSTARTDMSVYVVYRGRFTCMCAGPVRVLDRLAAEPSKRAGRVEIRQPDPEVPALVHQHGRQERLQESGPGDTRNLEI